MKKILSTLLACTMITTAAIPSFIAFAEDIPDGLEKTDIDVTVGAGITGTRDEILHGGEMEIEQGVVDKTGVTSEAKIYVEVDWDDMYFVYDFGTVTKYEWDLETLKYEATEYSYEFGDHDKAAWNKTEANIHFTNFSNRPVWAGVEFEKNTYKDVYKKVNFAPENGGNGIVHMESAVVENQKRENLPTADVLMVLEGEPDLSIRELNETPALGVLKFYIATDHSHDIDLDKEEPATETPSGEHEHHYVYDQFGRLVCTGCNEVKHEYCIDEDEDGLCDECGIERDFCPDCHIGGTCKCI